MAAPALTLPPRRLSWLVALLSAIGPFSIDAYLPAFGAIGDDLRASPVAVQQTLSIYMVCFGVMNLWHGAISDALGRRRVLLVTLLLFTAGSLGAALAGSIEQLWFWRAVQGVAGGAGMTIGRAVVRDCHAGADAQRMLAQVMMIFALAPAIAPIVGGQIAQAFGWRAIFVFLALFALAEFLAVFRWLPETLPPARRQSLAPARLLRGYAGFFGALDFWRLAAALAFNFQGLFLIVMAAPVLLPSQLGLGMTEFGWVFVPTTLGGMAGGWLASRLAGRRSIDGCIRVGYAVMGTAAALNLAVQFSLSPAPLWLAILPYPLYTLGLGVSMSSLQVRLLDLNLQRAGMASSCQSFVQSVGNAATAAFLAPLLWHSTRLMAVGMAVLVVLGGLAYAWHVAHRGPAPHDRSAA